MKTPRNTVIYAESATPHHMDDAKVFTMDARGAALEELRKVDGKAEIVRGRLVVMSAAGARHGIISLKIAASLDAHIRAHGMAGYAVGDNVGFIVDLPDRQSFSPDAAYFIAPLTDDFVAGAPLFAVEIRSKDDYGRLAEATLAAKRADYFAAGTLVVWDVDVRQQLVRIYRRTTPTAPVTFTRGADANAEPAVPGWQMAIDNLFPAT